MITWAKEVEQFSTQRAAFNLWQLEKMEIQLKYCMVATIGWITIKLGIDIHARLSMNYNNFSCTYKKTAQSGV